MIERGEVQGAELNPRRGTEPGKTQTVLIVQAQALLDVGHPSTLVVPLATRVIAATELLRIRIPAAEGLQRDSDVLIDQVRAIDNRRLVRGPLTQVGEPLMTKVGEALLEVLDLAKDGPPGIRGAGLGSR